MTCYLYFTLLFEFHSLFFTGNVKDNKEKTEITILITTKTKQSYEKSIETAENLIKNYSPSSLAAGTLRFSIITGRQSQLSIMGDRSNSKIEILQLVSNLKYSVDNPAELRRALEFVKSKVYGSCTIEAKCNTPNDNKVSKPRKVFMLLIDRKLEERTDTQRLAKELSDSGVNVIVAVASDSIEPDSPVVVTRNDGNNVGDEDDLKVLVYPTATNSANSVDESDLTPAILKMIGKGKCRSSLSSFLSFYFDNILLENKTEKVEI